MGEDSLMEPVVVTGELATRLSRLRRRDESLGSARETFEAAHLRAYEDLYADNRAFWQDVAKEYGLDLDAHTYQLSESPNGAVTLTQVD